MREAPNCAKECENRLVVRIYAGNSLKCEYVRETAKSAILHTPHLSGASAFLMPLSKEDYHIPIESCQ